MSRADPFDQLGNAISGFRAFRSPCPKGRLSPLRLPGPTSAAPRVPVQRTFSCFHEFQLQVNSIPLAGSGARPERYVRGRTHSLLCMYPKIYYA